MAKISTIPNQAALIPSTTLGLGRRFFVKNLPPVKQTKNPYEGAPELNGIDKDPELYRSTLGTPVYTDLTFKGGSYTDAKGNDVTFREMKFVTVLMVVSQAKVIERTKIQGRDGTVKEYIGLDDYKVSINGIITATNGSYPWEDTRKLKDILDAPMPIEVVSSYLQNLDIFSLVVDDYAFDQDPGGYSKQNFSINCSSDVPIELQIQ